MCGCVCPLPKLEALVMEGALRLHAEQMTEIALKFLCVGCGYQTHDRKYKRCAGCLVRYCGQACQRRHWPKHKAECRTALVVDGKPTETKIPESFLAKLNNLHIFNEFTDDE